MFSVKRVFEQV